MLEAVLAGPEPKAVVFTCNWNAYSALETAGLNRLSYPASVRPVKLMCLGRLHPGLILKAFELGAGGVLLLGCPPGECHYGFGNQRAEELFAQTKALAHLLGFGEERLHLDWMAVEEGEVFAQKVRQFAADITNHQKEKADQEKR
jgi:F420-non-reducing hydrogenase iron-sulfur subunit